MELRSIFIVISSLLALVSPLVYSHSILKGKSKPHRTTRFVLVLITSLATASLFAQGNRVAIWLAAVSTIQSVIIFTLSLKFGMGGWSRSDIFCLILALAGVLFWQTTSNPIIGLYFSILADFTGMIPAIIKTYKFPKTEIWSFHALDVFAAFFSLLAITSWTMQEYSYPLYIMIINAVMAMLIVRPKRRGLFLTHFFIIFK
ncbi:MAG: hypothetical protein ABIG95_06255 [Candidatus Woesearchaeota archaeon]